MKKCFILCPIGTAKSKVRTRSDQLLKYLYQPALETLGYEVIRADKIPKAGLITSQIIELIFESPLVIADLTGGNPNVYYELAIRHYTGKPYIQVIQKGEKLPFDLQGVRTIEIDHKDLDSIDAARKSITAQIKEFESGHIPDSPITTYSSAKEIQGDMETAEKVVHKISQIDSYFNIQTQDIRAINNRIQAMEREFNSLMRGLLHRYTGD